MRLQLKKHESKLKQLREELRNRKNAVDNAKDKQHVRIENDLLQTNREAYMFGNQNWLLLQKHVFLVQQYCQKYWEIPAKQDIQHILDKALTEGGFRNDQFYNTSKQNSKKDKTSSSDNSSACSFDANDKKICSQLLNAALCSEQEETKQLAIAMREGLHEAQQQTSQQTLVSANMNFPIRDSSKGLCAIWKPVYPNAFFANVLRIC